MQTNIPLIIDCDPGNNIPGANVDDAIALAYAALNPDINLASIWTVFGNTTSDLGYYSATNLLQSIGVNNVTVLRGADGPQTGDRQHWIDNRLNSAASNDAPLTWRSETEANSPATQAAMSSVPPVSQPEDLAQDILRHNGPVDVVAIGPMTNIASLITSQPKAAAAIRSVYAMGGAIGFGSLVDTNFAVDPQAARTLLESGIPMTLVPLDVTRTTCLSRATWQRLLNEADGSRAPWKSSINDWLSPWLDFSERTRPVDGMWIHDLVALAALSNPDLVSIKPQMLSIGANGKLYLADNPDLPADASSPVKVRLATAVDNEALIRTWAQTVLPQ